MPTQNPSGRDAGDPHLVFTLFGTPQVTVAGEAILGAHNERALALLAYLAVERRRAHPRTALAAMFWPDEPAARAQQNLRQTLSRLRRAIAGGASPVPCVRTDAAHVQFDQDSGGSLDVEVFERLVDEAEGHVHRRVEACDPCVSRLERAVAVYRGSLLEGFHLSGASTEFEEWLFLERERLAYRAWTAMLALANSHLARARPEAARAVLHRLLAEDPWNEAAERLMMHALARTEGRNAALRHYRAFRRTLRRGLGVEPEPATGALEAQLCAGQLTEPDPHDTVGRIPLVGAALVGREADVARVRAYLAGRDERLVTVHGPGGIGKTRVAIEVAEREAPLWRDGVWFVPLAELTSADEVPRALQDALRIPAAAGATAMDTVMAALRGRETLLVLDTFEHLVPARDIVGRLIRSVPGVKVVVTSRTRLALSEEWVVDLEGLGIPPCESPTPDDAATYDAVRLFAQVARRGVAGFEVTPENVPHIVRICRAVAGLPLGIELAAGWVRLMSCCAMADEIERDPCALHEPGVRTPGRGQSLRSTFAYSCDLLSTEQQAAFRRLSVFRGGFTPHAADAVAGADADVLATLVDHSLVQCLRSGRLDVHTVLRDLAADELGVDMAERDDTHARHSAFYLALLRERVASAHPDESAASVSDIDPELANLRAAWRWAVARADAGAVRLALGPLVTYYLGTGRFPEAQEVFGAAADSLLAGAPDDPATLRVAAALRVNQAEFAMRRGLHAEVAATAAQAVELARRVGDEVTEAEAEFRHGVALRQQGAHDAASRHLQRALDLDRGARPGRVPADGTNLQRRCLNDLAAICWGRGDPEGAESYLEQMRDLAVRQGNRSDEAVAIGNLGVLAEDRGDYALALGRYRRSLELAEAVGRRVGAGHLNMADLYLEVGAYDEAEECVQTALAINREQGALKSEVLALCSLSRLARARGDMEGAAASARAALDIVRRLDDPPAEADVCLCLGWSLAGQGALSDARDALEHSHAQLQHLGRVNHAVAAQVGLAHVLARQGDLADAVARLGPVIAHLETGTLDGVPSRAEVYLACHRVLCDAGDPRSAQVLAAGHRDLHARAACITDETMRRSFLENVAAHRAIVAAWADATFGRPTVA